MNNSNPSPRRTATVVATSAVLLCLLGCDHEQRLARLEKETTQLQETKSTRQDAAEYDLREKCSRDAKVFFGEGWRRDKDTLYLDYSNHYNKRMSKCFIYVEYHYNVTGRSDGSWANNVQLWDVQENVKYGEAWEYHTRDLFDASAPLKVSIYDCDIAGQKCKTLSEFSNLERPYLSD